MQILWYIQSLRFLTFFLSISTFICHISQCVLLNTYQKKTGIPNWLTAGHWQYLLWFISLGLSLVGSLVLCLGACYYNKPRRYIRDKYMGALAIIPLLASIITAMLSYSLEPWTNGLVIIERASNNILSNCELFDATHDKFYPLLYQRCLLSDFTWMLSIALCILWISLVGLAVYALADQEKVKEIPVKSTGEPLWGRYMPERPASMYSITSLNNPSGLLTPSKQDYAKVFEYSPKHTEYYSSKTSDYYSPSKSSYDYSPPKPFDYSLPKLFDYTPSKPDDYFSPSSKPFDYSPSSKPLDNPYYSSAPSLPSLLDYYPVKEGEDNSLEKSYPPSVSSLTHNNNKPNLTIDCDYKPATEPEPVSALSGTPLYNSFARRAKNTSLSFRD